MNTQNQIYYDNATNEQKEYIKKQIDIYLLGCQSVLIDELLKKEVFNYDDIINLVVEDEDGDEIEDQEIYEWYFIDSSWFADKLIQEKEPVLHTDFGRWWGRRATGQSVDLDQTFWVIFQDGVKEIK